MVLPISSANIPLVASAEEPRPVRDLKVTMTLDERDAAEEEQYHLEVKTSAQGLVPELKDLLSLPPKGFEVANIDDRELQIEELTTETDDGAPLSSHEYRITLKPEGSPKQFAFPVLSSTAKSALAKDDAILRQRYRDVDLLPVGKVVELTETEGPSWFPWLLAILLLLALGIVWYVFFRKQSAPVTASEESNPEPPQNLTAVNLLHWLKRLQNRFTGEKKEQLLEEISQLERRAFSAGGSLPGLEEIAKRWK